MHLQKSLPLLNDGGSIILNSAAPDAKGDDSSNAYAAINAALQSLPPTWTSDLRDRKIRVSVISPDATETPGINALAGMSRARSRRRRGARGTFRAALSRRLTTSRPRRSPTPRSCWPQGNRLTHRRQLRVERSLSSSRTGSVCLGSQYGSQLCRLRRCPNAGKWLRRWCLWPAFDLRMRPAAQISSFRPRLASRPSTSSAPPRASYRFQRSWSATSQTLAAKGLLLRRRDLRRLALRPGRRRWPAR